MSRELHNTACAYVVDSGCVLLIKHRGLDAWFPPGGHIEPGETPGEAAARELVEETGIGRSEVRWGRTPSSLFPPGVPAGHLYYGEYPEADGRVYQVHSFVAWTLYDRPRVVAETEHMWLSLRASGGWPPLREHVEFVLRHLLISVA